VDIKRLLIADCTVVKLSELMKEDSNFEIAIEKALLAATYGTVFIISEENILLGIYLLNNHKQGNKVDEIEQMSDCVYEDANESIEMQVIRIVEKSDKYTVLPIVDNKNILKGGVLCSTNIGEEHKLKSLAYLSFIGEKGIDMGEYFRNKGYLRIAFWGVDKLSLTFANLLKNCGNISVAGIYDNIKRKKYCNEDVLNYEIEVNYVDTFNEVLKMNSLDLILITDWTMKHINNIAIVEKKSIRVEYGGELLESREFTKEMNTSMFLNSKTRLSQKGVEFLSVCIPIAAELNMDMSKKNDMTNNERLAWFAKENDWESNDIMLGKFGDARQALGKNIKKLAGNVYYADFRSEHINYINKTRIVLNQPKEYCNTVYLLGPCIVAGLFNQDKNTMGYFLQEYINNSQLEYKVVAIGVPNDANRYYHFKLLEEFELKKGNKVFWIEQSIEGSQWDLSAKAIYKELYEIYGTEFFYDTPVHLGKSGMKQIANLIFNHMLSNPQPVLGEGTEKIKSPNIFNGNPQLEEYKRFLQSEAIHHLQRIGSIVMNCNPFTLGHQYLIEYAASKVDILYIFIVEEDKSFFKFKDRIELVKAGTAHIENVKVLPSGEFIISTNTFSEYFDKANLKGVVIDTSLDVETFAEQIAPVLDIKVRFVGEEPLDPVTNQYNQSMKDILPKYGIELNEIPRKELGEMVISASRVRKAIEEKKWDEVKVLVPKTTYEYLDKNYKAVEIKK